MDLIIIYHCIKKEKKKIEFVPLNVRFFSLIAGDNMVEAI